MSKNHLMKKVSISIISLALICPLALGGIQSNSAHAKNKVESVSDYESPSRWASKKANRMNWFQLKRAIKYDQRQLRKAGKRVNKRTANLNNLLLAEQLRLNKINKNAHKNMSKKAIHARWVKSEKRIERKANSLKKSLGYWHASRIAKAGIRDGLSGNFTYKLRKNRTYKSEYIKAETLLNRKINKESQRRAYNTAKKDYIASVKQTTAEVHHTARLA